LFIGARPAVPRAWAAIALGSELFYPVCGWKQWAGAAVLIQRGAPKVGAGDGEPRGLSLQIQSLQGRCCHCCAPSGDFCIILY
jgi:hypothetical protein